ncbi:hypothetical protein MKZ38_010431 [Zalerion maritima]|uniref:Sodium/calcium exchanger membrane region domain-containing protein n=1 Tax=Zalerion maritima TaxID=339359 RepID=A0AAD5RSC3_9PEZI|nr:hypothetical protein MKZ38_010431 [Zalerion maritima]
MKEFSSDSSFTYRIRSWARSKTHGGPDSVLPLSEWQAPSQPERRTPLAVDTQNGGHRSSSRPSRDGVSGPSDSPKSAPTDHPTGSKSRAPPAKAEESGVVLGSNPDANPPTTNNNNNNNNNNDATTPNNKSERDKEKESSDDKKSDKKLGFFNQVYHACKLALFHSWFNVLLVFVPVGIISHFVHAPAEMVFAMNAVAIIPLAGLLSFATESVAHKMGDAIGALLNVTFGNAVELIIFIIALVKNEIRIVQSSLLGSILANLLLILGMSFFLGGLRFQEQVYNATVTQMSACLLSLSVMSLVLPTAFHASFENTEQADRQSLKISRGTSVILLLVYVLYLMFQLKSHAYLYESTPQHIVENEYANPGPVHRLWESSSSSDSSSSSSSDSDNSNRSRNTMTKRVKRAIRAGRRRKSSVASIESQQEQGRTTRASSFGTGAMSTPKEEATPEEAARAHSPRAGSIMASEEAVDDGDRKRRHHRRKHSKKHRKAHEKRHDAENEHQNGYATDLIEMTDGPAQATASGEPVRLDFAVNSSVAEEGIATATPGGSNAHSNPARRSLGLRTISLKPGADRLVPTVFKASQPNGGNAAAAPAGPVPRVRFGIRRTNSLPDRLNQHPHAGQYHHNQVRLPGQMPYVQVPLMAVAVNADEEKVKQKEDGYMTRGAAVVVLLLSTALVAICAEFLVDSIEAVVESSSMGEIFIGLIILPIVGNAAEHVTAVAVAMKNKMDLSIGVAIGSSIQIALFITPLVVILGWILDREMTLYFSLFETVCLFVSAFIVNFLVLDGRSNYLEGALLCATYVIIAVVAFFYPAEEDQSEEKQLDLANAVTSTLGNAIRL